MLVTFARGARGSTLATVHRRDGVVLELQGYDRRYRVPHDLAHAVTESALGMDRGVFGSIAGGAVFASMRVVTGRPRHDAAERSRRLLAANTSTLGIAEVLAAVVHHAVEHDDASVVLDRARRSWGVFSAAPLPWTTPDLTVAITRLTCLADAFGRTGTLDVQWPDPLTSPMPEPTAIRRGRRGRVSPS